MHLSSSLLVFLFISFLFGGKRRNMLVMASVVSNVLIDEFSLFKIQLHFAMIRKFSRNFANFSCKIAALHCVVSGLAKKYEPAILV